MSKKFRFVIILTVLAVCYGFLYPTLKWYFWTSPDERALAAGSREKIKDYAQNMAKRDVQQLIEAARANSPDALDKKYSSIIKAAQTRLKSLGAPEPKVWTAVEVVKAFPASDAQAARALLEPIAEKHYRDSVLKIKNYQANAVKLGLDLAGGMSIIIKADLDAVVQSSESNVAQAKADALDLAIQTLSSRIDKFGLSEPVVRKQGEDRIYIELPGATDADRINSIIMGRGLLAFHLVDAQATEAFYQYYAAYPTQTFDADYNLLDPSIIPQDTVVFGVYDKDEYGLDQRSTAQPFLVVKKEPGLPGRHITDVSTYMDRQTGKPQVAFSLDAEGTEIFGALTTEHVNERLAIVSDEKIRSAPVISTAILGGQGSISGFSAEEAENLKTVLRTAWLNVPLQIESRQVIGANTGEQMIRQGLTALQWGLVAVFAFMLLWYLEGGINAIVCQILNLYILFSILSAFNLTLTLSSIAGMILTVGMAVDASVIIFERMKDERRLGASRRASIDAGFSRAFWAIMDSNITTFIAALFLSMLGTGLIKGFAYSLAIGVVSSVFTALFVSRLMFDFSTDVLKRETLRISWRKLTDEKDI